MKKIVTFIIGFFLLVLCTIGIFSCLSNKGQGEILFITDEIIYSRLKTNGKEKIELPPQPSNDGYVFDGWYFDKEIWNEPLLTDAFINKSLNEQIKVFAKWTLSHYNISYKNTKDTVNDNVTSYTIETSDIILKPLEKSGYDFLGWYKGNEKISSINKGTTGDIILEAKWSPKIYSASFYADNVFVGKSTFTVEDNEIKDIPQIPQKKGYVGTWSSYSLSACDLEINAVYTPVEYEIIYIDSLNAENYNVTSYTIETATFVVEDLSKENYVFDGWYDENDNRVQKIETGTTGDITLWAKWSVAEFSIIYQNTKNAKNPNPAGYNAKSETIVFAPLVVEGYVFEGWYDNKNNKVTSLPQGTYGDIILTALWSIKKYEIKYANTKGAINSNLTSYTIETATFDIKDISIEGYIFKGWYENNEKIDKIAFGSTGNRELSARWEVVRYKIEYENTKGAANYNVTVYTVAESFELYSLIAEGYVFEGWYENGKRVGEIEKGSIGDKKLTAKWTAVQYKIEYENTKGAKNDNQNYYTIDTVTFDLLEINYVGYSFLGWYDENGDKVLSIEKGTSGDKKFTAKWKPTVYTATFFADGVQIGERFFTVEDLSLKDIPAVPIKNYYEGVWENYTLTANNIVIKAVYTPILYTISFENTKGAENQNTDVYTYESPEILLLPLFPVNGYRFEGWYVGDNKVESIPSGSFGNKSFNAKWSLIDYSIIYQNLKGAENSNATTYNIESDDIILYDVTAEGYTFTGWYLNNKKITTIPKGSYGDKYLTAAWATKSFKVSISSNVSGATYTGSGTYKFESLVTVKAEKLSGYIWDGWYIGETILSDKTEYSFSMPAEDISLIAKYNLCESHVTDKNCVCIKCGKVEHKVVSGCTCSKCGELHALIAQNGYCLHESFVYMGYYPQTIKSTSVTINNNISVDENGCFTGSDGKKYAKVVASPKESGYKFSSGSTINSGSVYYFKVEPIKWQILEEEDGKAFLRCENIIDTKCFNPFTYERRIGGSTIYANNWQYSSLREWLNGSFYKTAFGNSSQSIIQSTYLDNKNMATLSTDAITEKYVKSQNNTYDKVFLLCEKDMYKSKYGFSYDVTVAARTKFASDYARASGVRISSSGRGQSWVRSPASIYLGQAVVVVDKDGYINAASEVERLMGVIPSLWIKL